MEVPLTVARAALFGDAAIAPDHGPCVDALAVAKVDLASGTYLDRIGGYTFYKVAANYSEARRQALLPVGLAEGAKLLRAIAKDEPLRYGDVELDRGLLAVEVRQKLESAFPTNALSKAGCFAGPGLPAARFGSPHAVTDYQDDPRRRQRPKTAVLKGRTPAKRWAGALV